MLKLLLLPKLLIRVFEALCARGERLFCFKNTFRDFHGVYVTAILACVKVKGVWGVKLKITTISSCASTEMFKR